jgi:hypothetical protein
LVWGSELVLESASGSELVLESASALALALAWESVWA